VGRSPRRATGQAVGSETLAVGPQLKARLLCQEAIRARDSQSSAPFASAAAVRD
jgi:hypothetical protein